MKRLSHLVLVTISFFLISSGVALGQEESDLRIDIGAHVGRSFSPDQTLFGIEGRIYPSGLRGPLAVDLQASYYPVNEFLSRTAASIFASWSLSTTDEVDFSGGPGLEYWRERFEAGDLRNTNTYTQVGVHLEAKFRVSETVYPVAEARMMGWSLFYWALKAGVRVRIT